MLADRHDESAGGLPDTQVRDRAPARRALLGHEDFLEAELREGSAGGRRDIEKRGDLRLEDDVRHLQAGARVRLHDLVRTGEPEIPRRRVDRGAGDDREVGPQRARREGDEEVGLVGVGGGDERARPHDPGPPQVVVARSVSVHDEPAVLTGGVQRLLVVVEDDV